MSYPAKQMNFLTDLMEVYNNKNKGYEFDS